MFIKKLLFSIWKYLMSLSSGLKKTTILITTHYIEEARQASAVGLMRNGRLLAEDAPDKLVTNNTFAILFSHFIKGQLPIFQIKLLTWFEIVL